MSETTTLFRPVGPEELRLVAESGYKSFPPRLPGQPIFYPVLNEEYATQIARDWNAKNSKSGVGYVTRFAVQTSYLAQYEVHKVGGSAQLEYWIPADGLEEFNQNIVGKIVVVSEFHGSGNNRRPIPIAHSGSAHLAVIEWIYAGKSRSLQ